MHEFVPRSISPSGIPFPMSDATRRGDDRFGPIANIEKRQSPALSDVMNARKILLAPARTYVHSLSLFRRVRSPRFPPPAVSTFSHFAAADDGLSKIRRRDALIESREI